MTIINITPAHFLTSDGKAALSVDENGFPQVSRGLTTEAEKSLAVIALAIYENCLPLHESMENVETVSRWVRQFKSII